MVDRIFEMVDIVRGSEIETRLSCLAVELPESGSCSELHLQYLSAKGLDSSSSPFFIGESPWKPFL